MEPVKWVTFLDGLLLFLTVPAVVVSIRRVALDPVLILVLGKNRVELQDLRVLLCMTPLPRSLIMCPCTEPMTLLPRAVTMTAALAWPTVLSILTTFSEAAGLRPLAGLLVSRTRGRPMQVWVTVICRRLLLESLRGQPPLPLASFMALSIPGINDPTADCCALTILRVNVMPLYMAPPPSSPQLRNMKFSEWWHRGIRWPATCCRLPLVM